MVLRVTSIVLFFTGLLPLLAFTFFSPGLGSNGAWDIVVSAFSIITVVSLLLAARQRKRLLILVVLQIMLVGLLFYTTLFDGALYIGT